MYVAVQRVRSATGTGINALLYQHHGAPPTWQAPERVPEENPGELVSQDIEIPPGGNAVVSFVDVVALDERTVEQVARALASLRGRAISEGQAAADGVGIRFSAPGWPASRTATEWDELTGRALRLLRSPPEQLWRQEDGVTIRRAAEEDELVFRLTESSVQKLRAKLGQQWRPVALHIPHATIDDLRSAPFSQYEEITAAITGFGLAELLPYGRVRIEDAQGTLLWEWPTLRGGLGYCLTCRRQHTLHEVARAYRCGNCGTVQANDGRFVATMGS